MSFEGIYIALATPFDESGAVDHAQLATFADDLVERGVHGLVPCGTTAESAAMDHDEHIAVIRTVVDAARGRVPVVAGTGSNATAQAIELTVAARDAGADGALLIAPYYNKPTQDGLYEHFAAIAHAASFPLVVYNIPGRTAVNVAPETIARLARLDEVVGLKEATGDITVTTDVLRRIDKPFSVLAGDDAMTLPMAAVGGSGVISVVAQVAPEPMVELWDAFQAGDLARARTLHEQLFPLISAMFVETNPAPVKEALQMLGVFARADLRLPLVRVSMANRAHIREALAEQGLVPES